MTIKPGDKITIGEVGYNRKGQFIIGGRRPGITRGRKNKLVKLKVWTIKNIEDNGDIDLGIMGEPL